MNHYYVEKVEDTMESIEGQRFSPIFGDYALIEDYPWGGGYWPRQRPVGRNGPLGDHVRQGGDHLRP